MSVIAKARQRLARWIAPPPPAKPTKASRVYANAKTSRLTNGWNAPNDSADSELISSLMTLRARSRALVRDAPYAKRAKIVVVNNVIGSGIGMQAQVKNQRGRLMDDVNNAIEAAWAEWCCAENCHTGGRLHFSDLERQLMGQVFEGGEIFVRKHYRTFGRSKVPLALEIVEPERLAEDYTQPLVTGSSIFKMGIEQDEFGRPVAFWMRRVHPSEVRMNSRTASDYLYRVPADQMFHLAVVDRWPQTRGEPWLHAVARRLEDMDGLSEAEIVAARGAASYMGVRKPAGVDDPTAVDPDEPTPEFDLEPGAVVTLNPGEEFEFVAPNRPNANLDPFMRFMLREVAAGIPIPYESISGDWSQSNFSSSRMGQHEYRDSYTALQQWFIRSFRKVLHAEWLQSAVLAGAIPAIDRVAYALNPQKFEAATFKPRGWSYINPKDDIAAAKEAIKAGLSTRTHEIARYGNGLDVEDIDTVRRQELDQAAEKDLAFDTDPEAYAQKPTEVAPPAEEEEVDPPEAATDTARVVPLRSNA